MAPGLTSPGVLGRGGRLARVIAAACAARGPQLALAEAVQHAVSTCSPLVVEAGAGTGKSLADLADGLAAGARPAGSAADRGLGALLDPRLQTKTWGQTILSALPPSRRTAELAQVARCLAQPHVAVRGPAAPTR